MNVIGSYEYLLHKLVVSQRPLYDQSIKLDSLTPHWNLIGQLVLNTIEWAVCVCVWYLFVSYLTIIIIVSLFFQLSSFVTFDF